jgi:hypothetical protein
LLRVGDGEGDGDGLSCFGFDGDVVPRFDDRLDDVVGSELGGRALALAASSAADAVGSGRSSFVPTVGAASPSPPGMCGRMAATGEESAFPVVANVTTVAAATVVMTVAAANLYSLVGGTAVLLGVAGGHDNVIHRSGDGPRGHIRVHGVTGRRDGSWRR